MISASICEQNQDLGYSRTGAVGDGEHVTRGAQCCGYVRIPAAVSEFSDCVHYRLAIVVLVEIKPDVHVITELQQADARQVSAGAKRAGDVFGEREKVAPLEVVNAARLIQSEYYVGFPMQTPCVS